MLGKAGSWVSGSVQTLLGLALLAALLPATASAAECTNNWSGGTEGNWQFAANWSAEHVPTSADVVCVGSGKTVNVTTASEAAVVQGSGTVALEASLKLTSSSEASVLGRLTLGSWTKLSGPGTLEISEHLTWGGGEHEAVMSGEGTTVIQSGATVTATPGYNANLEGRTFVNEGTFNLESGDLLLHGGAEFINEGTFDVTSSAENVLSGGSSEWFLNVGTFERTGGSGHGYIYTEPDQV